MTYHSSNTAEWNTAVIEFEGEVAHRYQNGDVYGTDKFDFRMVPAGETVNLPVWQRSVARNEEDGIDVSGTMSSNANDVVNPTLEVDKPLKDNRRFGRDQLIVRPDLRIPENYSKQLGTSIAEGKSIRMTGLLLNGADDPANGVSNIKVVNILSSSIGSLLAGIFEDIAGELDENGVPASGRFIGLKSTQWYKLLPVTEIRSRDFSNNAGNDMPGAQMAVIQYANFNIINIPVGFGQDYTTTTWAGRMPPKYRYDSRRSIGTVWHEDAVALRHWQDPTTMVDWSTEYNAFKAESFLIMGAQCTQAADAVYMIKDSTSDS